MALKNSFLAVLFFLLMIGSAPSKSSSQIVLPELLAKQAIANLRFISSDGKFTYYQKRSGSLLYSSNYKVIELLKGEIGTQYTVFGSGKKKKLAFTQNNNFHNFYSLRANEKIFIADYGETQLREIGLGTNPQLHAEDNWLSYFNFYTRTIYFEHTVNSALKFTIKLNNRINPYFIPKIVMPDDNTVFYTDLSELGVHGLLEFKRNVGKSEIILKAPTPMAKLEICVQDNSLIVGTFGINFSNIGSIITKASLPLTDFNNLSKGQTIYTSIANDIGQLHCNMDKDIITFIKNIGTGEVAEFDIVDLNITTKAIKFLSELKTISSIINMDGTLLTLEKGRYLIVKGNFDFKNIDALKSLPPAGAIEAIKQIDDLRVKE